MADAPHRPASRRRLGRVAALLLLALGALAPAAGADTVRPGCAVLGSFSAVAHPGACWRPFAPDAPYNQRLLPRDPRTAPDSARIVERFNAFGAPDPMEFGPGIAGEGRGAKPVYWSRPTDPEFRISLTADRRNGGDWGVNDVNGATIRIPEGARPGPAPDRHMVVVDQASGWSYDLWHVGRTATGGGELQAEWGGRASLTGDGRVESAYDSGTAAGMSIVGGIVRPEELIDGDIPHAIYISARCTSGRSVYPSTRTADDGELSCSEIGESDTGAPALGQRFQLGYTDEQIAALPVKAHERVLLRAMAHYGLFVIDTSPGSWHVEQENPVDRTSFGLPDPGLAFAASAAIPYWAEGRRHVWDVAGIRGADGRAGSWRDALRVIDPCVSAGTCPPGSPVPATPGPLWPTGPVRDTPPATTLPTVTAGDVVKASATVTTSVTAAVGSPVAATGHATATATATATAAAAPPRRLAP
ncbi:MAG: hypothetical protein F2817_16890, partial [Actinobacteria bacterium]|nr:hypothetical protein [Actinomycetota bacterium]